MHYGSVLSQSFKMLPPAFRDASKTVQMTMGNAVGERDILTFTINGVSLKFNVYYAHQISHLQLHYIQRDAADAKKTDDLPTLVLSQVIYSRIAQKLMDIGVNFMDATGNVYLNEKTIYIQHTGQKTKAGGVPTKSRLFGDTGLKLLFALLQDPEVINFPYRELANLVGISPASITIIFKEMLQSGYLFEDYDDNKRLLKKRELLQRWVNGYNEILRPKLLIGRYQSFKKDMVKGYEQYPVADWQGNWGGEPAAASYTKYLSPEKLTMYVPKDEKSWMKKMSLVPVDDNHEIEVLSYFWDTQHPLFQIEPNLVPPLLVYAELTATGDSRNLETAQRIYDEYLQYIEQ
jgi:hypothetical protein